MSSIGRNFLYNAAYQMLLIVLPLITTPYISRVLGVENVGIYTYTYTAAGYFLLFAMLGVKNYGNRSIAAARDNPTLLQTQFWEIWGLQLICSVAATAAYLVYMLCAVKENRIIALLQGVQLLAGMLDISWLFMGLENFRLTAGRSMIVRLVSLGLIFWLVRDASDLWIYTLIMAGGVLVSQAWLWLSLKRSTQIRFCPPTWRGIGSHLRAELVLFVPVVAVSLYKMMDKLMLGAMSSYTQLGYYENTDRILGIPLGLITALGTVMLPRMSHLASRGETEKSREYIRTSIVFAMFFGVGLMFGISGVAEDFVPLFLGEEFRAATALLRVMSPTILFIAWANVIRTQYLIPNHRDKSYIISVVLGAAVNIGLNLLLIPRMNALGAVIGTLCAEAAVCISQTVMVHRDLQIGLYLRQTLPFLTAGALMYLLIGRIGVWLAPAGAVWAVIGEIFIGGTVYVLLAGGAYFACSPQAARQMIGYIKAGTKKGNRRT